jgi:hypothetical protein
MCFSVLISILNIQPAFAHQPESGKINVALGPLALVSHGIHHPVDTSPLFGFALIVSGDVDENGGIEIALMPMNKMYSIEREGQRTVESSKRAQITAGYRHWLFPWLSGGLGFFSSYVMGDAAVIGQTIGDHIDTSARDAVEYGFEASVQFEAFRREQYSAILDTRYAYSVTPKGGEEGNHYAVIVALKYEAQARGKPH